MRFKFPRLRFNKEYFLFLLPVFFVFHGYVENYSLVPVPDALFLLFYYVIAFVLIDLLLFLFFRSWRKSSLMTAALMMIHFFFGSFHDFIKSLFGSVFITSYTFILCAIFLLIIAIAFFI